MKLLLILAFIAPFFCKGQSRNVCDSIDVYADKFKGDTTYTTPTVNAVTFFKNSISRSVIMVLKVQDGSLTMDGKGVIILMENNKRIERRDAEIEVKAAKYGYLNIAYINLTAEEQEMLQENLITDYRLNVHDMSVQDGSRIRAFLKCIISK